LASDYYLVAVVTSPDTPYTGVRPTVHSKQFAGGIFLNQYVDDSWHVHGSASADVVTVNSTSINVTGGLIASANISANVAPVQVRTHGGHDVAAIDEAFAEDIYLFGGAGDDELTGGAGADTIDGGDGIDELYGQDGNDFLFGGTGDDAWLSGGNGNDTVHGGDGNDANVYGDAGDDLLYGDLGNDTLDGGVGNNSYIANGGTDTFIGNVEYDGYIITDDAPATITISDPGGFNAIDLLNWDHVLGVELVLTSTAQQTLSRPSSANQVHLTLQSGSSITLVDGSQFDDSITGGLGDNTIYGHAGNDTILGGSGNDILIGADGSDTLWGGVGNDELQGGADQDSIYGEAGDDLLRGGSGDDELDGGSNNDLVLGDDGTDSLTGGSGNDTLDAGTGDDAQNGGTGDDTYRYWTDGQHLGEDTIDEAAGQGNDSFDLSGLGLASLAVDLGITTLQTFANVAVTLANVNTIEYGNSYNVDNRLMLGPLGLYGSAEPTSTEVQLDWQPIVGASKYVVERRSGGSWSYVGTTTATEFTDSSVAQGKSYDYRVRAHESAQYSYANGIVTWLTSMPQITNATFNESTGNVTLNISYSGPLTNVSIVIEALDTSTHTWHIIDYRAATSSFSKSHNAVGLNGYNADVYYRVWAENSAVGTRSHYDWIQGTTTDTSRWTDTQVGNVEIGRVPYDVEVIQAVGGYLFSGWLREDGPAQPSFEYAFLHPDMLEAGIMFATGHVIEFAFRPDDLVNAPDAYDLSLLDLHGNGYQISVFHNNQWSTPQTVVWSSNEVQRQYYYSRWYPFTNQSGQDPSFPVLAGLVDLNAHGVPETAYVERVRVHVTDGSQTADLIGVGSMAYGWNRESSVDIGLAFVDDEDEGSESETLVVSPNTTPDLSPIDPYLKPIWINPATYESMEIDWEFEASSDLQVFRNSGGNAVQTYSGTIADSWDASEQFWVRATSSGLKTLTLNAYNAATNELIGTDTVYFNAVGSASVPGIELTLDAPVDNGAHVVFVNSGDADADGVIDWADGFNAGAPGQDNIIDAPLHLTPLTLEVTGAFDASKALFAISYDASDPAGVTWNSQTGGYDLPAHPGPLRIWKKDAEGVRAKWSPIFTGGDYVAPGVYTAAQLGLTAIDWTAELYVEAVKDGEQVAREIRVQIDPDGAALPAPFSQGSALAVNPLGPKLEWVTWDRETGEVRPVDDVIYPSDPRPEVALEVEDAYLDTNENLVIEYHVSVFDALSEVAEQAADRVQELSIIVNGEVVDVIDDLATSGGVGTMPWQLQDFSFEFDRTLTLPKRIDPDDPTHELSWGGETVIVLAQTSENGAGNVGWDRSAVVLGWRNEEEFSPSMGNPSAVGEIIVGDGDEIPYESYLPVVERIDQQEGSAPGSFYPMVMRLAGLTDEQAELLEFTINGEEQQLEPFAYSPIKHYVVGNNQGRPRIFVVTLSELTPNLEEIKPENLVITNGDGDVVVQVRTEQGGIFPIAEATVKVLEDDYEPSTSILQLPSGPVDMPTLLMYYQLLYGETGVRLLGYFNQAGGEIVLHDRDIPFSGEWDVDWLGDDHVTIQIEHDINPIKAAEHLASGLQEAMAHISVRNVIIQNEDFDALKTAYQAQAAEAAKVAAAGANIYLSGISIVNEGADIVMTVSDVSEGRYYAAIGFLPFISGRLVDGAEVIIKRLDDAGIIARFDNNAIDALSEAVKKTNFDEQFSILQENLSVAQRLALVDGGILRAASDRTGLKRALQAAGQDATGLSENAAKALYGHVNAHHDFLWDERKWFIAHGIDVNKAEYGRWVAATKPGTAPAVGKRLHQSWSLDFKQRWVNFIADEPAAGYTKQQVIDFMMQLRSDFPSGGL
jgi:Ca2+-binding RTX toxin-like protein